MRSHPTRFFAATALCTALAACAGSKFDVTSVDDSQKVVIGKFVTTLNGTAYADKMEVCFEGKNSGRSTCVPVDERGYTYFTASAEPYFIRKLDLGNHADIPSFTFDNVTFNVSVATKHTYIGTVYTDITITKDPATANLPKQTLIEKLRDGYVSGNKYDVKLYAADELRAAMADYARYTVQDASTLETATSLASTGKGLTWRSHVRAGL